MTPEQEQRQEDFAHALGRLLMTMSPQPRAPWTSHAIAILLTLGCGVLVSWLLAFYCSKTWQWLLEPRYGEGPSMGAWFGISVIVTLLLPTKQLSDREMHKHQVRPVRAAYERVVTSTITTTTYFMAASLVAFIWGWK